MGGNDHIFLYMLNMLCIDRKIQIQMIYNYNNKILNCYKLNVQGPMFLRIATKLFLVFHWAVGGFYPSCFLELCGYCGYSVVYLM